MPYLGYESSVEVRGSIGRSGPQTTDPGVKAVVDPVREPQQLTVILDIEPETSNTYPLAKSTAPTLRNTAKSGQRPKGNGGRDGVHHGGALRYERMVREGDFEKGDAGGVPGRLALVQAVGMAWHGCVGVGGDTVRAGPGVAGAGH